MDVPEPALPGSGLGRTGGGEGVRMDSGQGEMAEREPHVPAELLLDQLDRMEGLPRVRALVIAVLEDHAAGGRAADMIDFLIQRRRSWGHNLRWAWGRSGWLGGLEADSLADEDDVDAAGQFLVDLEDLPDLAVLSVGGLRARHRDHRRPRR